MWWGFALNFPLWKLFETEKQWKLLEVLHASQLDVVLCDEKAEKQIRFSLKLCDVLLLLSHLHLIMWIVVSCKSVEAPFVLLTKLLSPSTANALLASYIIYVLDETGGMKTWDCKKSVKLVWQSSQFPSP